MKKDEFISLILSKEFYDENPVKKIKEYNPNISRDIRVLSEKLRHIGKPTPTMMISVYSKGVNCREVRRVHLPIVDINSNVEWFSVANTLCELLCDEVIYTKSSFVIEKEAADAKDNSKMRLFEKRFDTMINQLIEKCPGAIEVVRGFAEKVECLKSVFGRCQYNMEDAKVCMEMYQLPEEEIQYNLMQKENHPDWKLFANEEDFYYIEKEKRCAVPLVDTLGPGKAGFWMELSNVYCL